MDEKQLFKDFFRYDRETIARVVIIYRDDIILFANGYVKDIAAAEDVASDTFVKLMIKKPKIRDVSHFKTYLFSIAKNTAFDYLRKLKRERKTAYGKALDIKGAEESAEELVYKSEQKKAVLQCLRQLNPDYGSVLFLHYYENMPVEDMTKILGKNKKQIYNLLQRAKAALKPILIKEGIYSEEL